MLDKENDANIIINKIIDKGKITSLKQICSFTDFLNLYEQNLFMNNIDRLSNVNYNFYGGYGYSERKLIAFYPDYITKENIQYPVNIIKIYPRNNKFSKNLTHRDFLGAILNLGITRAKIGDILVKDNYAVCFVSMSITNYIMTNLQMVKQTSVDLEILDTLPEEISNPRFIEIRGTVSSIRLDSIISLAFPLSRGKANSLIKSKNVYINSKLNLSPASKIKEGDIISVRGLGKFLFDRIGNKTKKDRIYVELKRYS
ncbi:MAG: YlmH/Sll1252 family protein [Vallitalea sp.]|jgi:RNA-binding protein YlmH|nr:YlmH/Sll1252 family protein [Vallitalea sp.]